MRNYRASAASQVRIDYGIALTAGLSNFAETRPHAAPFRSLNDELDRARARRIVLRKPMLEARQAVRFADYNADVVVRSFSRKVQLADDGRRGPLSHALFPDGVTPVVVPSGAAQLPVLGGLVERLGALRLPGIDALRDEELPKLQAARTQLQTAVTAYQSARDAYHAAFVKELAIRDEHRLAVTALMGTVRSLYPNDLQKQNVIFPDADISSPHATAEEPAAEEDADAPADA